MNLLDQLLDLHRKELKTKNIPFTEKQIKHFRTYFINATPERIQQEIASKINNINNPITPKDKEAYRQQRKERAEKAKQQREETERARKEAIQRYEEKNLNLKDYEGFTCLTPGFKFTDGLEATLKEIKPNGDLLIHIDDPGFCDKHVHANKTYTFELHTGWEGSYNMWSLNEYQHECVSTDHGYPSYGADMILIYDEGDWLWDLDS